MRTLTLPAFVLAVSGVSLAATGAFAHGGHVGDLAGHSHWVGWAAAAAAAALAAWAAKRRQKAGKASEGKAQDETSGKKPEAAEA